MHETEMIKLESLKASLEKEYGRININLATGEYVPAATEEKSGK
jgi:hypothetical protein